MRMGARPDLRDPEVRATMVAKSREARARKVAERAASTLRKDFAEADEWLDLARKYKVILPPWGEPVTKANIEKYLRRCKVSVTEYRRWYGESPTEVLDAFAIKNPTWPMRALCGLVLESIDQGLIKQTK